VVKQYHITGNTVLNSCLKIQNNDDRDFSLEITFICTLKIFREFGMSSKSLGTNLTPRQKKVQLEGLGEWNPRADVGKLKTAANFAGTLQGWRQMFEERSNAWTLNTNYLVCHPSTLPRQSHLSKHGTQNNSACTKHDSTLPLTTLSHT